jgi:RimJ/RimL family protein N-acetyltransferase
MGANRTWHAPRQIATERLLLRCPRQSDSEPLRHAILASLSRLRPWFNWAVDVHVTELSAAASVRYARLAFDAGTEYQYFIFVRGETTLAGVCGLTKLQLEKGSAEVAYWLNTGYEGRGIATEAVGVLVNVALDQAGFRRIEALCDVHNDAGQAVLRRLGFEPVLLLPGHHQHPDTGEWSDVVRFAREA